VTNLRLPGQYDERLCAAAGISGLQGPYYNWNRWYLPSAGRYLELDPQWMLLAPQPEHGGFYAPDWYGYAAGNPFRFIDPYGLCNIAQEASRYDQAYANWRQTPGLGCGPINGIINACGGNAPMCVDMAHMLVAALQRVQSSCCKPVYTEWMWPRPIQRMWFYHATVTVKCRDDCSNRDVDARKYDPYWRTCSPW
jgi:RHS repeat-associated protein